MPRPPMLEVHDLHVAYGHLVAVHGVSLQVPAGQLIALVGANGAGKTSLLRCIAGLQQPRAGRVTLAGEPLTGLPSHLVVRQGVVMVPEGRRLFTRMNV